MTLFTFSSLDVKMAIHADETHGSSGMDRIATEANILPRESHDLYVRCLHAW